MLSEAHDHPDVEEVYRRALALDSKVSIADSLPNVRLFEERGILERHDFGGGRARYEPTEHGHHHHLIDVDTGQVVEFGSEEHEQLAREIAAGLGFELVGHRLELFGRRAAAPPGERAAAARGRAGRRAADVQGRTGGGAKRAARTAPRGSADGEAVGAALPAALAKASGTAPRPLLRAARFGGSGGAPGAAKCVTAGAFSDQARHGHAGAAGGAPSAPGRGRRGRVREGIGWWRTG